MSKFFNNSETDNEKQEFKKKSFYECEKSFFEYLKDMKSGDSDDDCDYCAAFMLI